MIFISLLLSLQLGLADTLTPQTLDKYVIEKGDSLSTISVRLYGVSSYENQIYDWNRNTMRSMDDLKEGSSLILRKKRLYSKEAGEAVLLHYYQGTEWILTSIRESQKKSMEYDRTQQAVSKGQELLKQKDLISAQAQFTLARVGDATNPVPRILEISTLLKMGQHPKARVRVRELISQDKDYCALPVFKNLSTPGDCL